MTGGDARNHRARAPRPAPATHCVGKARIVQKQSLQRSTLIAAQKGERSASGEWRECKESRHDDGLCRHSIYRGGWSRIGMSLVLRPRLRPILVNESYVVQLVRFSRIKR